MGEARPARASAGLGVGRGTSQPEEGDDDLVSGQWRPKWGGAFSGKDPGMRTYLCTRASTCKETCCKVQILALRKYP